MVRFLFLFRKLKSKRSKEKTMKEGASKRRQREQVFLSVVFCSRRLPFSDSFDLGLAFVWLCLLLILLNTNKKRTEKKKRLQIQSYWER